MSEPNQPALNRLLHASSPYLRQHAGDPVDWYPWGPAAFAEAKRRDVPIFLSVGYSACHWCHVMQHQVFQNAEIAAAMNAGFINIKVDREERPDIDEAYMLATQLVSGSGGWPMSVWLTPELKPFYAGTYFPPCDSHGRPGFPRLIDAIMAAWRKDRAGVIAQADELWRAMEQAVGPSRPAPRGDASRLPDILLEEAHRRFDPEYGGFRGMPKFPPHQVLHFWIQLLEIDQCEGNPAPPGPPDQISRIHSMLTLTLDSMQWGGIHDLVGGAFARYSTDEKWHVPHFEKMLYDNAQLAEIYARVALLLQRADYAFTARRVLDFWLDSMSTSDGLFYSSIDADSEGEEGRFYTWTWQQLSELFADQPDLFDFAARVLDISRHGNWEGTHVLQLSAQGRRTTGLWSDPRWHALMHRFHTARQLRTPPEVDTKVITAWNGLMLSALAHATRLENAGRYDDAGTRLVAAIRTKLTSASGAVLRGVSGQQALGPGFLDDYAYLARGLIDWAACRQQGATDILSMARHIIDTGLNLFSGADGELFTSAELHGSPLKRMRADFDNAVPSPSAVFIGALLDVDRMQATDQYTASAQRALKSVLSAAGQFPVASATLLSALGRHPAMLRHDKTQIWRVASCVSLEDGRLRLDIEAGVPHPYKLLQPPTVAFAPAGEQDAIEITSTPAIAVAIEAGNSEEGQICRYRVDLAAPVSKEHRWSLVIHYTLCDDRACLPAAQEMLHF